jgi:hypothetical protein
MSDTSPAIQPVEDKQDPPPIALPPLRTDSELLNEILKLESVELPPYGVFGRAAKNRVNDVLTPAYYGMESLPTQASFEGNIVLIPITWMLILMVDGPQIRDAKMRNKVITDTKRKVEESIGLLEDLLKKHSGARYSELVTAEVDHRKEILATLGSEEIGNRLDVRMGSFAMGSNGVTPVNSVWQTATDVFLPASFKSTRKLSVSRRPSESVWLIST